MLRDMQGASNITLLLNPATLTASTLTREIDMRGYQFVTLLALIGTRGDTWDSSNHIQIEVEESQDNITWTDAPNSALQTYVTGANTGTFAKLATAGAGVCVKKTTYRGGAPFVRAVLNLTGTHSSGTIIGIAAIRYGSYRLPAVEGGVSASASTSPSSSRSPSKSASPSLSPSASQSPSTSRSPSSSASPST